MAVTLTSVEQAFVNWISSVLSPTYPSLVVLWQDQDIGQPTRPFVELSWLSDASPDAPFDEVVPLGSDNYLMQHRREGTIQVWIETYDVVGTNCAREIAKLLTNSHRFDANVAFFTAANATILRCDAMVVHHHFHETRFYGQVTFDVHVRYASQDAFTQGGISTAKIIPPATWTPHL